VVKLYHNVWSCLDVTARELDLFRWLDRLDHDEESVVTCVWQPALREALRVACELGMDATVRSSRASA